MHHLLITIGSHGDTHPYVGIGKRLRARGHRVTLAANGAFASMVRDAGLEFAEIGSAEEFQSALANPDIWHPARGFRIVFEHGVLPVIRRTYDLIRERYVPGQTVVTAHSIAFGARIAQEKLGVPLVTVQLAPVVFRSAYAPPVFAGNRWMQYTPPWLNRILYRVVMDALVADRVLAGPINAFRGELGLPPAKQIIGDWWLSPQRVLGLFPDWYGPLQPDWPRQLRLTGFPLFDERGSHELPQEVEDFLQSGDPPLAFTFGSAMTHAKEHLAASAEACRLLNRRGLLLTRFAEQLPARLPEFVKHVRYAPFSELLPRCATIVHHGGIGTTAQSLAAGVPQLIVPFAHDQHDNAARVRQLGCGLELNSKRYRPANVAKKLAELLNDEKIKAACRAVTQRFMGVDALEESCDVIEALS